MTDYFSFGSFILPDYPKQLVCSTSVHFSIKADHFCRNLAVLSLNCITHKLDRRWNR